MLDLTGKRRGKFGRLFTIVWMLIAIALGVYLLAWRETPEKIIYGASFSQFFAEELGLDWKAAYIAVLDELGIRRLRLAAYWPLIEKERGRYDFSDMDFQIEEASKRDAEVILAVGRRLPRWPECHIPGWAEDYSWEDQKIALRELLIATVDRYREEKAITHWQVENEPYLSLFAYEFCGELDEAFLKEEVELVKTLDPSRPVIVTDSGNLGLWYKPYRLGDAFGTSLYIYFWTPEVGQFKTRLPAAFYRLKANLMRLLGEKEVFLIELSAEPWLVEPIKDVDVETQLTRMDIEKFENIIEYAKRTKLEKQYLWGPEWWYWMKEHGHPEFWEKAREIYRE